MLGSNSVYPKSLTKTEKDIGCTSPPSCSPLILNSALSSGTRLAFPMGSRDLNSGFCLCTANHSAYSAEPPNAHCSQTNRTADTDP